MYDVIPYCCLWVIEVSHHTFYSSQDGKVNMMIPQKITSDYRLWIMMFMARWFVGRPCPAYYEQWTTPLICHRQCYSSANTKYLYRICVWYSVPKLPRIIVCVGARAYVSCNSCIIIDIFMLIRRTFALYYFLRMTFTLLINACLLYFIGICGYQNEDSQILIICNS